MHAIQELRSLGQSAWLEYTDRRMLDSGELERMIRADGLAGATAADGAVRDVAIACDLFRTLYENTQGLDGFVSIDVFGELARDTPATIDEARRLWARVARPNLMVTIPATREGIPAIARCLADGINVNATLLFSTTRYLDVVEAYLAALEERERRGEPLDGVASVASFLVSRIDAKVDSALEEMSGDAQASAATLKGRIGIANAKVAYEEYERAFHAERWHHLAAKGAHTQRLLWGSTTPRDSAYPPTYYVDALVGPDTVDTMTAETLRAYVDQGCPRVRLGEEVARAHEELESLAGLGIDLLAVAGQLEDEGVRT
jgi:transaldolase